MTRNRFFCYIVACTLVLGLTGCGNKSASSATTAPAPVEEAKSFEGEGPVQGGIKPDEEIAALQEEEQQYASEAASEEEPAEFVDNTGHEPDSYGSGNFQDYWQGDDYFDIVSYLKANGANSVQLIGTTTQFYAAYFDNDEWAIITSDTGGCVYGKRDHGTTDYEKFVGYDVIPKADSPGDQRLITLDENGTTIAEQTLILLDAVISSVRAFPDKDNPLEELPYTLLKSSF